MKNTPIVIEEARADADERQHEIQTEQMPFDELPASVRHACAPCTTDFQLSSAS